MSHHFVEKGEFPLTRGRLLKKQYNVKGTSSKGEGKGTYSHYQRGDLSLPHRKGRGNSLTGGEGQHGGEKAEKDLSLLPNVPGTIVWREGGGTTIEH